ncbi:hypothetical protein [Nakamurella aerolata]|uniref:Uncharacterized protein n=1 Tax=Nakamurella aerolata TaxID=1656892 RepID=A0A849AAF1_9ACTN|nr:hypothetical protein [Nakamurella aerolata]NNG36937.1 hypothetical protein [Nakamurella aerolata]
MPQQPAQTEPKDADRGDQSGQQPAGGNAAPDPNAGTGAPDPNAGTGAGQGDGEWQGKYQGQLQVNRNLESQLNQLKDGMKAALGLGDKKVDPADLVNQLQGVSALQEQVTVLTHRNTVNEVAMEHHITDKDDVALLAGISDRNAMEKLAARLAPAAGSDSGKPSGNGSNSGKPGTPRPDPSQGATGAGKATTSVSAGRDLWSERHPTKQ